MRLLHNDFARRVMAAQQSGATPEAFGSCSDAAAPSKGCSKAT